MAEKISQQNILHILKVKKLLEKVILSYLDKITVINVKEKKATFKFRAKEGVRRLPVSSRADWLNKMTDNEDQCAGNKGRTRKKTGFPGVTRLWQSKINLDCAQ